MEEKFDKQDQELKEQAKELENLKTLVLQKTNHGATIKLGKNQRSSHHISTSSISSRALTMSFLLIDCKSWNDRKKV